ncbi:MAG: glutamate 5-kinase [Actinobacteria bacterium]|nr:glutamate 5-kinase [Actinomycetota bacterium]NBP17518.1 glutamate 5-kinase [Actinomycetota bacterium]NBR92605.1 glutamate 5-kinase [Actinomycetota bacterium]NBY58091.1 glutamate 5-kinase [Actinomycetota bacterium]NDC46161.1 glutamate 5-kinase [Actinomycetota bacterium]
MRVVAKIGTSSLTTASGDIATAMVQSLCDQVAQLRAAGHEVLVVSSGAVAGGVAALGLSQRPTDTLTLQALSAVGQSRLMSVYNAALAQHDLVGAQVLLVPNDFVDRMQYLHARETLQRLLSLGCVPIINENDAIASDEIRYGDNDRIAALVAHSIDADVLVLLTDIDGLYTADPQRDESAQLVSRVEADDELLSVRAGVSAGERGSGGMASKLAAARIASWSGVRTVIARASAANVLLDAASESAAVGTTFVAHDRRLTARKLWIAFAAQSSGTVLVDDGARTALTNRGVSLLHAGVVEVRGDFVSGDTVEVAAQDGEVFARGLVGVTAVQARAGAGKKSAELPDGVNHEVIHRDDLIVF